jgi:phosphate transport system substrate-binding protein
VRWPTGLGIEGNPGIAELVEKIPGSISYVELSYAKKANLQTALLRNRSGNFIEAGVESVSSAARIELPRDTRILITDTPSPTGYPISAFSYFIFYKDQSYAQISPKKAESLARFLWWTIHEGQQHSEPLYYSRLPDEAVRISEGVIRSIVFNGKPVLDREKENL